MSSGFWEEEPEKLEAGGEPLTSIVFRGVREEARRIIESLRAGSLLEKRGYYRRALAGRGMLGRIPRYRGAGYCCLALDTSFTSPPLELTGGRLLVITRSHVLYGCRSTGSLEKAGTVGFVRFIQGGEAIGSPYSKIVEREFILEALRRKKSGGQELDMVLLDGELFPRIPPGYVGRRGSESPVIKAYNRVLELTQEVLELAEETETIVVGVVKRVYGMDLQVVLGDPSIMINDKAFSTFILENGEWINIGSYSKIAVSLGEYIKEFSGELGGRLLRSLNERLAWITRVIDCAPKTGDIAVATYKAENPTYFMVATKIEALVPGGRRLDELVSYLSRITGVNGVPHPIDVVDSMGVIKGELLHLVQQQLYAELARITGDNRLALSIAGLTNPEKMSRIGFR